MSSSRSFSAWRSYVSMSIGRSKRDEVTEIKRARLKDAIDRGYEDAAKGKTIRLETHDQIDAFFADL